MTPYYEDAAVTIYHADALELLPSLTADVTITDPPYNVGLDYSDGDRRLDYPDWTKRWVELAPRPLIVTPGIVNLAMWMQMEPPRWTCAWVKPNQCSPSAIGGFNTWEPILVYGKPSQRIGQDSWVQSIGQQQDVGGHPCPKFLPFWKRLLIAFSGPDDVVLDPFMGTGTTLIAAKDMGRKAIGIEMDERWCEVAARRCSQEVLGLDFGMVTEGSIELPAPAEVA